MTHKTFSQAPALLATASVLALLTAAPAFAQTAPQTEEAAVVDDIVVTGTRVQNRSRLDTLAPVDVVTAETLQQRGTLVYRRSDGALQLMEVVNDAQCRPNARRDHLRTRATGTALDWKEFGMTLAPLEPAEIPPQPGQKRRRR
jgi:hypothetical protein